MQQQQQQQLFQSRDSRVDERSGYGRTTLGASAHLSSRFVLFLHFSLSVHSFKPTFLHIFSANHACADVIINRDASGNGGNHAVDAGPLKWDGRDGASESGTNHAAASSDVEDWEKPENVGSILMTRQRRDEEYASWGAASAPSFPASALQQQESKPSLAAAEKHDGKLVPSKTIPSEITQAMIGVCRCCFFRILWHIAITASISVLLRVSAPAVYQPSNCLYLDPSFIQQTSNAVVTAQTTHHYSQSQLFKIMGASATLLSRYR